jgi:hypothetical protein
MSTGSISDGVGLMVWWCGGCINYMLNIGLANHSLKMQRCKRMGGLVAKFSAFAVNEHDY